MPSKDSDQTVNLLGAHVRVYVSRRSGSNSRASMWLYGNALAFSSFRNSFAAKFQTTFVVGFFFFFFFVVFLFVCFCFFFCFFLFFFFQTFALKKVYMLS